MHRLRGLGCGAFQGYLLGEPFALDDVAGWAAEWHREGSRLLGR